MGDKDIKSKLGLRYLRKGRASEISEYWIRYEESKTAMHALAGEGDWVIKEVKLGRMTLAEAGRELEKFRGARIDPWFRSFELLRVEPAS